MENTQASQGKKIVRTYVTEFHTLCDPSGYSMSGEVTIKVEFEDHSSETQFVATFDEDGVFQVASKSIYKLEDHESISPYVITEYASEKAALKSPYKHSIQKLIDLYSRAVL